MTYRVSEIVELFHAHGLDQGTTLVRKDVKGSLAMVVADTRGTRTTKGQVGDNKVDQGIVDDDTSGTGMVQDVINGLFVLGKDIEGQGLIMLVHILDTLHQPIDNHHGQDGSKDFTLHQLVRLVHARDQSGGNEQILFIHLSTHHDLALGAVQQGLEAQEMVLVHNTTIRGGGLGGIAVKLLNRALEGLDQLVLNPALYNQVIRRDAGLTTVEELAKRQSTRRHGNINVARDECRTRFLRERKRERNVES